MGVQSGRAWQRNNVGITIWLLLSLYCRFYCSEQKILNVSLNLLLCLLAVLYYCQFNGLTLFPVLLTDELCDSFFLMWVPQWPRRNVLLLLKSISSYKPVTSGGITFFFTSGPWKVFIGAQFCFCNWRICRDLFYLMPDKVFLARLVSHLIWALQQGCPRNGHI